MTVVFLILKFIGIIILCLIAILLLLLCIALFVPIRYKIEAGTRQLEYKAKIKVHWMLFFIRFYAVVQNQAMEYQLRIFGYPIIRFPVEKSFRENEAEPSKAHSTNKKKVKKKVIKKQRIITQKDLVQSQSMEHNSDIKNSKHDEKSNNLSVTKQIVTTDKIGKAKKEPKNETNQQPSQNKHKSLSTRFRKLYYQTKQLFNRIKLVFVEAKDKIKFLKRQYHKIKKQVTDERNKKAIKHIWKEITYLLRHFKPRKIKLNCNFSTTDPALTGQITQILCVIPFFYQKDIHIIPQFQEEEYRIMADIYMQGHIRLIHLLCTAVRVLFDKNIMKWIRKKF